MTWGEASTLPRVHWRVSVRTAYERAQSGCQFVQIDRLHVVIGTDVDVALQATLPKTDFTLAKVTDIQYPVQDWGPVIQEIKRSAPAR